MLFHVKANPGRREMKVELTEEHVEQWAWADYEGTMRDFWTETRFRGNCNLADVFERTRAEDDYFAIRPVGSSKNEAWENVRVCWDENGWYFTLA